MEYKWTAKRFFVTLAIIQVMTSNAFSQRCTTKYDDAISRTYYVFADKIPSYEGGFENLSQTIKKNLKWPGGRCCLEGTVFVSIIIEPDGHVTNKKILRGISSVEGCNADYEAIKVIEYLTQWMPGECDGKKVPVQMIIPVKFSL